MRRYTTHLIIACVCMIPLDALAAGIEFPDNGTIATGRGGAWAARPTDGLAFQYNPAGLAWQRGLRVTLDGRATWTSLRFEAPGAAAVGSDDAYLAPAGAIVYGFGAVSGLDDLTVAVGAVGPSAMGKLKYPALGAQRYMLIEADYLIAYASAAVAVRFLERFGLGLTVQGAKGHARFSQATWSGFGTGDDPTQDTIANVDVTSGYVPTAVAGMSVSLTSQLALGLSWRPAFHYTADGTLKSQLPASAEPIKAHQVGDSATLVLEYPDVIRAGLEWSPTERLRFEVDGVWEGWSVLERIVIETHDIKVAYSLGDPVPVPDIVFDKQWQDAWSVRLGAEWTALQPSSSLPLNVIARCGYLFETSAVPDDHLTVEFPNWQRHGVAAGLSFDWRGVGLDIAAAWQVMPTRDVSDSKIVQITTPGLPPLDAPEASAIGNGRFDGGHKMISVALRFALDGWRAATP